MGPWWIRFDGGDKGQALDRLLAEGRTVVMLVGDTPHDATVAGERGVRFCRVGGDTVLARLTEVLG